MIVQNLGIWKCVNFFSIAQKLAILDGRDDSVFLIVIYSYDFIIFCFLW